MFLDNPLHMFEYILQLQALLYISVSSTLIYCIFRVTVDGFLPFWQFHNLPISIPFKVFHFFLHCLFPLFLLQCFLYIIWCLIQMYLGEKWIIGKMTLLKINNVAIGCWVHLLVPFRHGKFKVCWVINSSLLIGIGSENWTSIFFLISFPLWINLHWQIRNCVPQFISNRTLKTFE